MSSMKPGEHSHGKTVVNRPLDGRYQRLVESARDVIYRLSPDGLITFLNPVFEQLTGWSAAEWIGQPFAPLVHEQDLPLAVEAFYRVLEGATPPIFELRIVTQDGGFRIGEFFETPDIEDGTVIGVIGIGRDVTARKQVELALRESESTLKTFFHTSSVMMGLVQVDGDDILHLSDNPATAKFFGRSPESLKGRKASELGVPPEHLQLWISQYRECERLGHGIQFEYRHASSTTEHWLLATVSPVSNAAGRANRFAYVVEDITEWKRAEQRLRQAHEELERRVQERTEELAKANAALNEKIHDLEIFHDVVVGRELRMMELEKENQRLQAETGNCGPNHAPSPPASRAGARPSCALDP